jgi:hypothetical protein
MWHQWTKWLNISATSALIQLTASTPLSTSFFFFIHMCIQGLGHFSPLPPPPPLPPTPLSPSPPPPPQYPAETILPLSLILLKREYKQQ